MGITEGGFMNNFRDNYKLNIAQVGNIDVRCFTGQSSKRFYQALSMIRMFLALVYGVVHGKKFSQVLHLLFEMCNRELSICIMSFHSTG